MLKIDKGVPSPNRGKYTATFDKMEIGDSVFVAGQKDAGDSAGLACHQYGKTRGKVFTCKKEVGGVRIWRLS